MAEGYYTKISITTCPISVAPGLPFVVGVRQENPLDVGQNIKTYVYAVGDETQKTTEMLDTTQYFGPQSAADYISNEIDMPEESVTIYAVSYIEYQGWSWDCYDTAHVEAEEQWWITVGDGRTEQELETSLAGLDATGLFRIKIETDGAPQWVLESGAWLFNASFWPIKALGVDLLRVSVRGNNLYMYIHASPVDPITATIIVLGIIAAVALGYFTYKIVVQFMMPLNTYLQWRRQQDVQEWMTWALESGYDPDWVAGVGKGLMEGNKPEKGEEAWYEKYVKYAVIGGLLIVGGALIVPKLVESVPKLMKAK